MGNNIEWKYVFIIMEWEVVDGFMFLLVVYWIIIWYNRVYYFRFLRFYYFWSDIKESVYIVYKFVCCDILFW